MSNYNELLERIGAANAKCGKLNEELRVREGKRQAFSTQLETAIADYKAKYGVDITPETIEAELARVSASVEEDLKDLEHMISLIEAGQYDEANALSGKVEEQADAEVPTQTSTVQQDVPVTPVQNDSAHTEVPVTPVQSNPVHTEVPVQSVTSVQPVMPTQPVVPTTPVQPTIPVQPQVGQPVMPSTPVTSVTPVTPVTPVQPTTPVQPSMPSNGLDSMLGGALAGFQPASGAVHPTAPPISGLGGIQPTVTQQVSPTNFQDILNGSAFGVK